MINFVVFKHSKMIKNIKTVRVFAGRKAASGCYAMNDALPFLFSI